MNILAISSNCYLQPQKIQKTSNTNKPVFKGYQESFKRGMTATVTNKRTVANIFKDLINSAEISFCVKPWLKNMIKNNSEKNDPLFRILNKLEKSEAIIQDSNEDIAYAQSNAIVFANPQEEASMTFRLNNDESIEFSRDTWGYSQIITFFPHSNKIKSEKTITGTGLGQTSETTYYNKDGTKRTLRNFINSIFGI